MTVPLPDLAHSIWGGGDWTPRAGGGVMGRIGYHRYRVECYPTRPGWSWEIYEYDRPCHLWRRRAGEDALPGLEPAIVAALGAHARLIAGGPRLPEPW